VGIGVVAVGAVDTLAADAGEEAVRIAIIALRGGRLLADAEPVGRVGGDVTSEALDAIVSGAAEETNLASVDTVAGHIEAGREQRSSCEKCEELSVYHG
jgi:hypothetical protein